MATLAPSPPASPNMRKRRPRWWARKIERYCCIAAGYFPLAFVYGLTTWAVWVEAGIGLRPTKSPWLGLPSTIIGISLYLLLNTSYTVAVFTDPGSPLTSSTRSSGRGQYSHLPTAELPEYTSYTVNSSGGARYCKKCQCPKPDRTHHCSSCKRCVLKMDHHCPWLATCVGLRNYKAFLLFLIYTSMFCWVCFATAALWVWDEVLNDTRYMDTMQPVNVVLLAIIGGIIGLVLTGFTAWHISLAVRGMTTIESLEKTRYLSPLRKALERNRFETPPTNDGRESANDSFGHRLQGYGRQILEAHANAIPGVTRAEEGEERPSPSVRSPVSRQQDVLSFLQEANRIGTPAQQALSRSYAELERQRERERYQEYLDSQDNEQMPNAFDLGWRRNLRHLFGDNPLLWPLPVCTTIGDGWYWEPNPAFLEARERIRQRREQEWAEWMQQQRQQSYEYWMNGVDEQQMNSAGGPGKAIPTYHPRMEGSRPGSQPASIERPSTGVSMKTLRPMSPRPRPGESDYEDDEVDHDGSSSPRYDTSSDEERMKHPRSRKGSNPRDTRSKADRVLGINRDQSQSTPDEWRDWD
ncbi:hypothetical protein VTN77DRAFT_5254 [Rasamsonia byssochlamydoides]|uniref:uncharacterized protein n=1 Tax=Rasamsonia byssochlamydoides TaxID=89139 RepID=UPI0037436C05